MDYFFDNSKTLNELEGIELCESNYDSHLVVTCCRLYKKPICEFETEDLRIMIGQNFGLLYLIPLAVEVLEIYCTKVPSANALSKALVFG